MSRPDNCFVKRARLWAAMRDMSAFTLSQLAKRAGCSYKVAYRYSAFLCEYEYLRAGEGTRSVVYYLVKNTGPRPPYPYQGLRDPNTQQVVTDSHQQVWNALRIAQSCSIQELETITEVHPKNLRRYVGVLERAGYLRLLQRQHRPGSHHRWQLIRNTGVAAPIVAGQRAFDANQLKYYPDLAEDRRP